MGKGAGKKGVGILIVFGQVVQGEGLQLVVIFPGTFITGQSSLAAIHGQNGGVRVNMKFFRLCQCVMKT